MVLVKVLCERICMGYVDVSEFGFGGPKINMAAVRFQDGANFRINTLLTQRPLRVRGMGSVRPAASQPSVMDPLTGR